MWRTTRRRMIFSESKRLCVDVSISEQPVEASLVDSINGGMEKAMKVKILAIVAAAVLGGGMMILLAPAATAKPEFAAQTGKACGACHQNPGGGGKLTSYGAAFKANGFKVKGK